MIRSAFLPSAALVLSLAACSGQDEAPAPQADSSATQGAAAPAQPQGQQPAAQQIPSPRDTVEVRFGDDPVLVDYGRPSMRGRTIMGELVPYGEVWRTGANEATTLVTGRDLRIGGVNVPAGTYTLYTLPGESEWQLIVNRQTGQWGTEYDQAQDLARIPLQVERLAQPVEQFTIDLQPEGDSAFNLGLRWENTRAWVRADVAAPGAR